jgi:hypothetical protein
MVHACVAMFVSQQDAMLGVRSAPSPREREHATWTDVDSVPYALQTWSGLCPM